MLPSKSWQKWLDNPQDTQNIILDRWFQKIDTFHTKLTLKSVLATKDIELHVFAAASKILRTIL